MTNRYGEIVSYEITKEEGIEGSNMPTMRWPTYNRIVGKGVFLLFKLLNGLTKLQ
jgi:hypothetical protein